MVGDPTTGATATGLGTADDPGGAIPPAELEQELSGLADQLGKTPVEGAAQPSVLADLQTALATLGRSFGGLSTGLSPRQTGSLERSLDAWYARLGELARTAKQAGLPFADWLAFVANRRPVFNFFLHDPGRSKTVYTRHLDAMLAQTRTGSDVFSASPRWRLVGVAFFVFDDIQRLPNGTTADRLLNGCWIAAAEHHYLSYDRSCETPNAQVLGPVGYVSTQASEVTPTQYVRYLFQNGGAVNRVFLRKGSTQPFYRAELPMGFFP